jgi:O-antigen/teichoic acid export membrane protein
LLYGSATLGLAVGIERVFGFLAAGIAARIGGPQTFGAYSVVLATAGTIAAYAGAGIGTTANRFSGQYPRDSDGYPRFVRALATIGISSATLAGLLMLAGAGPLARLLHNENLTMFLRLAAMSSAAIVLLECCRGLLIGQQKFYAVTALSIFSGVGLVVVLPLTARVSPGAMVLGQGAIALVTVCGCLAFSRRLGISPIQKGASDAGPKLGPVFRFGVVQFSAMAGISIASWLIASLVARSDPSLGQMGLYAVANQFRGLAAIGPGLIIQIGYALLTEESGLNYGGPRRVLLVNTFLTTSFVAVVAGVAMTFIPWILAAAYGQLYMSGEIAILFLLATAIVHMSGMPAAQRLSIVNLRATGIVNAIWAILIVLLGLWLIPRAGAVGAATAFLIAHGIGHAMVILILHRMDELPAGYLAMSLCAVVGALALTAVAYFRAINPVHVAILTVAAFAVLSVFLLTLIYLGLQNACVPRSILGRFGLSKALS